MADRMMKTVFDWDHFALYLSGPIDFAYDGGMGWREVWTNRLVGMGINPKQIYNPCRKPFNGAQFKLDDEAALARKCRQDRDWEGLDDLMCQIMHIDLRLVDKADIMLVNMPVIGDHHPAIKGWNEFKERFSRYSTPEERDRVFEDGNVLKDALVSMRVPTYGTMHEIVVAHLQRKPIFVVWEGTGKSDCSAWLMRLVGYRNIFSHLDKLIEHLVAISQGQKSFNANEWLLLDPK